MVCMCVVCVLYTVCVNGMVCAMLAMCVAYDVCVVGGVYMVYVVCMGKYTCMCVCGSQNRILGVFLYSFPLYCFETGSLTEPEACCFDLAG